MGREADRSVKLDETRVIIQSVRLLVERMYFYLRMRVVRRERLYVLYLTARADLLKLSVSVLTVQS